ncbi:MAG: UDP-3-O-[3-hydroxymyristoyl] N-acetylglucosamine deacetylase [Phycisphaerae bacterium]|nr:UDP-3-O-[3-hydroxymyristoyl] N-acetylglucosamine deacetylase [Phycisphaerae bacterium]
MTPQKTINDPVSVEGRGMFSGEPCTLRFLPAPENTGIVFLRKSDDSTAPVQIPADVAHLAKDERRTSLANGPAKVETVEHILAAVWAIGIDNIMIEISADEPPSSDSSSLPFVQALAKAGLLEQNAEQHAYVIDQPVTVSQADAMLAALPGPTNCLDILYDLDYTAVSPSIGRQLFSFHLGKDDFAADLAPARTFLTESEARRFQAAGIGTHLSPKDILVMGDAGPIDNELRFHDEHVRHKVCDLLGDLALLGRRLRGRIVGYKAGHQLNQALVRKLADAMAAGKTTQALQAEPLMDIRKIMRALPHRYPFLMIDRLLEIDGDSRALAVKNVSINEPFFQGHYPGQPIMPGVMIVEAMAQLSGILVGRRLEHTGKVAVLLSMDRVKMRRPVRPGDQLVIEAEALHVRARTGHCRCRAKVAGQLAAEADIKFMLVDAEPV